MTPDLTPDVASDLTEDDALAAVSRLTRLRLQRYVAAEIVIPLRGPAGPVYRPADLARLELLCDLTEHFDLDGEALAVVIQLIDQLHATRRDLIALAEAVQGEPDDLRARLAQALHRARQTRG